MCYGWDRLPVRWVAGLALRRAGQCSVARPRGVRILVRTDGGPRHLAGVIVSSPGDGTLLRQAVREGVSPIAIWCSGEGLGLAPPVAAHGGGLAHVPPIAADTEVHLHVEGGSLTGLAEAVSRCPGLRALRIDGSSEPVPAAVWRALPALRTLHLDLRPDEEPKRLVPSFAWLGSQTKLRALHISGTDSLAAVTKPVGRLTALASLALECGRPKAVVGMPAVTDLTPLRRMIRRGGNVRCDPRFAEQVRRLREGTDF